MMLIWRQRRGWWTQTVCDEVVLSVQGILVSLGRGGEDGCPRGFFFVEVAIQWVAWEVVHACLSSRHLTRAVQYDRPCCGDRDVHACVCIFEYIW